MNHLNNSQKRRKFIQQAAFAGAGDNNYGKKQNPFYAVVGMRIKFIFNTRTLYQQSLYS